MRNTQCYIDIVELGDDFVRFDLFELNEKGDKYEVAKSIIGETEICDTGFDFDDEYRAYLPNTESMLYIVFDGEVKTHEDKIFRDMCLAMYARKVDQCTRFTVSKG